MQMFKRIADIFNSHVNSALDKLEDPAKMISLMITELEDTQTKARSSMAANWPSPMVVRTWPAKPCLRKSMPPSKSSVSRSNLPT